MQSLFLKKEVVIAVGGSSLYLKALWEGFDEMPEVKAGIREQLNQELKQNGLAILLDELEQRDPAYYQEVDRKNGQRVVRALEVIRSTGAPFSSFRLSKARELPYHNLKVGLNLDRADLFERIDTRMDIMIANGLFEEAESLVAFKDHNALQTVGYTEIFNYLEGVYDKQEAIRLLKRNSRRYAKRQLTWFNRYDDIEWYEPHQEEEILQLIQTTLSDNYFL